MSTKGKPLDSMTEVVRRNGMEATTRQNLQLAASLGEQVHQHAAIRAAADPLGGLVNETLGPMSHPGSYTRAWRTFPQVG